MGGWCANCQNLRKRQNTHHPQFCTRDVDRRFCGGGAWISRSDSDFPFPSPEQKKLKISETSTKIWKLPTYNCWENPTGAHKRGLKPQIFRENRGKILPGKSGLFGANWGLFRAYRGLFGADWDRFFRTPQPRGKSRNRPERAFLAQLAPFGLSPRLLSPRLDFPETELFCLQLCLGVFCMQFDLFYLHCSSFFAYS